jgi:hypothetical protein
MPKVVLALNDSIAAQQIGAAALEKFKRSHSDFDEVFPGGINLDCRDGITHADVMHTLAELYTDHKARLKRHAARAAEGEALRAECQKHRDQYNELIANGWTPPRPAAPAEVTERRRIIRQKDGSTIVEELD